MSFLAGTDLDVLIDNGLKTAEFIQKNKTVPPPTYGRSAIGKPEIPARIAAWEQFTGGDNEHDNGAETPGQELPNTPGGSSQDNPDRDRTPQITLPDRDHDYREPPYIGDNKTGNAQDPHDARNKPRPAPRVSSRESSQSRDTVPSGDDKSQGSSESSERAIWNAEDVDEEQRSATNRRGDNRERIHASVSDADEESLNAMLGGKKQKSSKKLTNLTRLLGNADSTPKQPTAIKKGRGKKSASASSEKKQSSESGILHLEVEGQNDGQDSDQLSGLSQQTTPDSEKKLFTIENSTEFMTKLDLILDNQTKILTKLNQLSEIKEEVTNIKTTLAAHSLALSTLDSYINDLMIIVPSSGKEEPNQSETKGTGVTRNPDLKLVVGRDKRRGLKDVGVLGNVAQLNYDGEDLFGSEAISKSLMLEKINKEKNHAAKFVPSNDKISVNVILATIDKKIPDPEIAIELKSIVNDMTGSLSLKDIKREVDTLIDSYINDNA